MKLFDCSFPSASKRFQAFPSISKHFQALPSAAVAHFVMGCWPGCEDLSHRIRKGGALHLIGRFYRRVVHSVSRWFDTQNCHLCQTSASIFGSAGM